MNYLKRILYFYLNQTVDQIFPDSIPTFTYSLVCPTLIEFPVSFHLFLHKDFLRRPQETAFIGLLLFPAQFQKTALRSVFTCSGT